MAKKDKLTKIDYTLEQFLAEGRNRDNVIRTLEHMLKLMKHYATKFDKMQKEIDTLKKKQVKPKKKRVKPIEYEETEEWSKCANCRAPCNGGLCSLCIR